MLGATMVLEESKQGFPYEITLYDPAELHPLNQGNQGEYYTAIVRNILEKVLPSACMSSKVEDPDEKLDQRELFHDLLPLVTWSKFDTIPFNLSFFMVCKLRHSAFKFFYEMLSSWLVPGKPANVVLFLAIDFRIPDLSDVVYTACELMLRVEDEQHFKTLRRNLPIIETELRLGTASLYHASRILEIKGLSADVKTAMIQEHIVSLIHRRPDDFDYDIFTEMQHFLVMCKHDFKATREYRHMARMISVLYLFRKALSQTVDLSPEKRYLHLKFMKTRLHLPSGKIKDVLGVLVGMNFLRDNELFEERHLLKAIQNYLPGVEGVVGSFFFNKGKSDRIFTMYLEIEKPKGGNFSLVEIKRLKQELPSDLKDRIEHLMHPVFMPRNEEEVMRNILSLSKQLKYIRDIPQVIITFDKQTDFKVSFTVILLRVLKPKMHSIKKLFGKSDTCLEFTPEQVRVVGHLRNKYEKEANVFRLEIDKTHFLRADHSIDLYKARRAVFMELVNVLGECRDYNGGLITKQNEVFCALKDLLGDMEEHHLFQLENFFYSLTPSVMRNVLDPSALKTLFGMIQEVLDDGFFSGSSFSIKTEANDDFLFVMLTVDSNDMVDQVKNALSKLNIGVLDLASVFIAAYDMPCLGYIYRTDNKNLRDTFIKTIKQSLETP